MPLSKNSRANRVLSQSTNILTRISGIIDATAAAHGLTVFAEHMVDAQNRPSAHPNIDLLLNIVASGASLQAKLIAD